MQTTYGLTKTRLNVLALLICCLIAAPAGTDRANAQVQVPPVPVPSGMGSTSGKIDAGLLSKAGPQFGSYLLRRIYADVLAKAGPMVIEYQLDNECTATLTLTIKGKKEPFIYRLKPTGAEIKQEVFQLPETFGEKPLVAVLSINAENLDPANKSSTCFELFSIAMGGNAVGSLKINQLRFNPPQVQAKEKISVTYSFHSLADFDRAAVEFRFLGPTRKGESANGLVNSQKISGGVRRGETKNGTWDGKNQKGKISKGRHLLVVMAWFEAKNGGDWSWVSDTSRQRVIIE
jgi:hypothetical protein